MTDRMLSSAQVMAFIATADATRARAFYESVLGLRFLADEEFALVFDANGTPLRVQKVREVPPSAGTVLGWVVPDIAMTVRALGSRGVGFERHAFLGMTSDIWTAKDGTQVAWFKDPDGNLLSLTEFRGSSSP